MKGPIACLIAAVCGAVVLPGCAAAQAPADRAVAAKGGEADAAPKIRTPHQYLYVVYLNPSDRECMPGYRERLDGAMTMIQQWYRREMKRNGFGEMTFPLERDADGKLIIRVIQGTLTYDHGKEVSNDEVWEQVRRPMIEEGIDVSQEHLVIVQNANYFEEADGETKILCWAPYNGDGTHRQGAAFVTDSDHIEPSRIPPTGIGGIAHELGHAFGLPHNKETDTEREELGIALMGRGNYHFMAEVTGKEKGAYLTKAHAIALSSHPLFKGNAKDVDVKADCRFLDVEFAQGNGDASRRLDEAGGFVGEYVVRGHVEATPRAYALLAYHDDMTIAMDYEATSWVADFDEDGRFEVRVGELKPGPFELRLRCYMVNGDSYTLGYEFEIGPSLEIPIAQLDRQTLYELHAKPAIEARDPEALLAGIEKLAGLNDINYRRARAYYQLMTRTMPEPVDLAAIGDSVRQVPLSSVKWASAAVGWGMPMRDAVPVTDEDGSRKDMPLESGAQFHETGLYAHATSSYVFDLDGNWKRLTSGYGLLNVCKGSVVFVVKCDGEERFRSELVDHWVEGWVDVDLTGVETLELIVEDGGDGRWADCGLWFSPVLSR